MRLLLVIFVQKFKKPEAEVKLYCIVKVAV